VELQEKLLQQVVEVQVEAVLSRVVVAVQALHFLVRELDFRAVAVVSEVVSEVVLEVEVEEEVEEEEVEVSRDLLLLEDQEVGLGQVGHQCLHFLGSHYLQNPAGAVVLSQVLYQ
jgi:hypothetical protein